MGEVTHRIRLIRQFVESLEAEEIPEALRQILVIPEGRNYVDIEVPTETARALRDVADKRFWSLDERTQGMQIRAAHTTRTLIEGALRRDREVHDSE